MNGVFFISYNDESYVDELKKLMDGCFDSSEIFIPIGSSKNSIMSYEEFLNSLDDIKSVEFKIIDKFNDFKSKSIIVVGDKRLGSFNAKIANNLDIPVIFSSNEYKIPKIDLEREGVKLLGKIDKKDLLFAKSGKNIALTALNVKPEILADEMKSFTYTITTPVKFEYDLYKRARSIKKTVVLPEGDDERILRAADILLKKDALNLIILGDENDIKNKALNLGLNLTNAKFINPLNSPLSKDFTNRLYNLRKDKGVTLEKASELIKDKNYFATMLILLNMADGVVSGAVGTTADTIRPALQIIKTQDGVSSVSGAFIMCLKDRVYLFSDCAIMPEPTASNLAEVATLTANMAKSFNIDPKVAMLSFATGESGCGQSVDKVKEATNLAKTILQDRVDGPLQFDAAVDMVVAQKKLPNSKVAGNANVFVFPDLNSANICYKAVQRTTNAIAIGPILQGLKKPVNDLSRGCLVEDIVNTVLITAIQANKG
ncbi:phosphate acetyltransferase [Campylobacter corcagiensis]|uniref:Phosphate acetyltransferase n=1 Tax=Campylobacter corcagiensis TaxID=1448857 RepID=A0A7M1LF21_9BACT|nr:phosphate acetyltransferase [Campylobacter corcagiensis]QKF64667.1 phosphate acetyltransferase [Campylobacter corcagiensis]QOQ87167.1 phosphate acetyltransferase [Campylobacter corcagiensis]